MNELPAGTGFVESKVADAMAPPYGMGEVGPELMPLVLRDEATQNYTDISPAALEGISCQFVTVTPEMAVKWLSKNAKNRKLRDEVVKAYARDMVNGDWLVTHQGIAFNDKNELIDGQHRLNAVIEAGVSVVLLATFGLPSQLLGKRVTTMDAVDRGTVRTIGDQLALQHDLKDANLITGICAAIAKLCVDIRIRKLTVSQVLSVFEVYKDSIGYVIANRSKASGLRTAGVLGALAFAHAVEGERIAPLFEQLNSGENLTRENPILQLRNFLMSSNTVRFQGSMRTRVPEITLFALHCALIEKPVRTLRTDRVSPEGLKSFRERQAPSVEQVAAIFELPKLN